MDGDARRVGQIIGVYTHPCAVGLHLHDGALVAINIFDPDLVIG